MLRHQVNIICLAFDILTLNIQNDRLKMTAFETYTWKMRFSLLIVTASVALKTNQTCLLTAFEIMMTTQNNLATRLHHTNRRWHNFSKHVQLNYFICRRRWYHSQYWAPPKSFLRINNDCNRYHSKNSKLNYSEYSRWAQNDWR